ncbi:MAG: hypothetical protein A2516_00855 [Alphaproteobacteria bacterium RIFOXYD12_FULL_60_8]|nr:MAG: hypothetical protein A2516_00855 [Alphaproteobacteria bacterium RIFOXYD12_FULL_60_8]
MFPPSPTSSRAMKDFLSQSYRHLTRLFEGTPQDAADDALDFTLPEPLPLGDNDDERAEGRRLERLARMVA